MAHEDHMKTAIETARIGIQKGQTSFGSCIVSEEKIITAAYNNV